MTKEDCRKLASLAPALLAYAEGRKIQGQNIDTHNTDYWWDIVDWFSMNNPINLLSVNLRIKPEPKLRAWKPEEVPVGAVLRRIEEPSSKHTLTGVKAFGCHIATHSCEIEFDNMFRAFEWKWPQEPETAWKPCGVLSED